MVKIDTIDRRIISALDRDGRQRLGELAQRVGLSATPLARRIAAGCGAPAAKRVGG